MTNDYDEYSAHVHNLKSILSISCAKAPTILFAVDSGSRMHGTATASSDKDIEAIYVPSIEQLFMVETPPDFRVRQAADGTPIGENDKMTPGGVEINYHSIQSFLRDLLAGSSYAVEIAYSVLQGNYRNYAVNAGLDDSLVKNLLSEFLSKFKTKAFFKMVEYAQTQAFKYIAKGERLADVQALNVLVTQALTEVPDKLTREQKLKFKLNAALPDGTSMVDRLVARGYSIVDVEGHVKPTQALLFNQRQYLTSSSINSLSEALKGLMSKYGGRAVEAAYSSVDYKSMYHAVRVYQEVEEFITQGTITLPRKNTQELLDIKYGKMGVDDVKALIASLNTKLIALMDSSTLPELTPELKAEAQMWTYTKLKYLYELV